MCTYFSEVFKETILPTFFARFKRQSTRKSYLTAATAICNYFEKDFLELTPEDISHYFSMMKSGEILTHNGYVFSSKSIAFYLSGLGSLARYIAENGSYFGITYSNPFVHYNIEESPYIEGYDIPSLSDIDRLLRTVTDARLRIIYCLVLRCGLSTSEIISLAPKQFAVDSENRMAIVFKTEGKDPRFVKVPEDIRTEVSAFLVSVSASAPQVFLNKRGQALTQTVLSRMVRQSIIDAGLRKLWTLQDLRNACACHMLASGAPPVDVAHQLGIEPRWMYRYDHAVADLDLQASDYSRIRILSGSDAENTREETTY